MVYVDLLNLTNTSNALGLSGASYNGAVDPIINVVVQNNLSFLQWTVAVLLTYIVCIVFHELGHWLALYVKNRNPSTSLMFIDNKIKLVTVPKLATESPEERIAVILAGIAGGFMAIGLGAIIHPYIWLLVIPYCVGFNSDIRQIADNIKEIKENKAI